MHESLVWKFIIRLFISSVAFFWLSTLAAQSCGSRDTTIVNPNNQLVRTLTISDYVNDDLADSQQGLCAVELNFVHQYVENMELTLTSPAGQTVELIGPNSDDQFAFTLFTQWRISFVPCSETAEPDPLFSPRWDNEQPQNWESGGQYSGSYYPYIGCLEDFNFGSVNGDWTLTVNNNPSANPGAITSVRLIFCDLRGVECCLANGGRVTNEDILTCAGEESLILNAESAFPAGQADEQEYAYTYALAQNDQIIEWNATGQFDLQTASPATYEICGLSYRRSEQDSLPSPATSPGLQALRDNLNSLTPDFCGDLSSNCQIITIVPLPDTTFLDRQICTGDSVQLGDTFYRTSGRYYATLPSLANCDSVIQLDLEVLPLPQTLLQTTICAEDSVFFAGRYYRTSGTYRDTLPASGIGCDSIVTLELDVLESLSGTVRSVICAGTDFVVGDSIFQESGTYLVPLVSSAGCDSLVTFELTVLNPNVSISGQDTLDCIDTTTTLRRVGQGDQAGTLRWFTSVDDFLSDEEELIVTTGGWYYLELLQSLGGISCSALDSFFVTDLRMPLIADAGLPQVINCQNSVVSLGGVSTSGTTITYQWSASAPVTLTGTTNEPTLIANQEGSYQLIVNDTRSRCADTSQVVVTVDTLAPEVRIAPVQILNCNQPLDTLDGSATPLTNRTWSWSGPCIEEVLTDAQVSVSCAGWYTLTIENIENACVSRDSVLVRSDFSTPTAAISPVDTLNCVRDSVTLSATNNDPTLNYTWTLPDASTVSGTQLRTAQPGNYELLVLNSLTGCSDMTSTMVVIDTLRPSAGVINRDTLNCRELSIVLNAVGASTGANINYQWFADGIAMPGTNTPELAVMEPARYQLEVTDISNGCRDMTFLTLDANFEPPPFFTLGLDQTFTCGQDFITIYPDSMTAEGLTLEWRGPCLEDARGDQWARTISCPGTYSLEVTRNDSGCGSVDTVEVRQASDFAQAILPDSTELSCVDATGMINTAGSSVGQYRWTRDGIPINLGTQNPLIGGPGLYRLIVENNGQTCADTATTVAYFNCNLSATIEPALNITCQRQSVVLDGSASTGDGPVSYEWIAPPACYLGELDGATLEVLCAGTYQLIVTQLVSGERDTAMVLVEVDNSVPQFTLPVQVNLSCAEPAQILRPNFTTPTENLRYRWTDLEENVLSTADSLIVNQIGTYVLEVSDLQTGCNSVRFVRVTTDSALPGIAIGSDVFPCEQDTFLLQAFITPIADNYEITWSGPSIRGATDQTSVTIETPGFYDIMVRNPDNGCRSSLSVEVVPQACNPCIELALPDTLGCVPTEVSLSAELCAPCTNCNLSWFRNDVLIPTAETLNLTTTEAGVYRVEIRNGQGLMASDEVTVARFPEIVPFDFGPPRILSCDNSSVLLASPPSPEGVSWTYRWEALADNTLVGTDSLLTVSVAGNYQLTVGDPESGCTYAAVVQVEEDLAPPIAEAGPDLRLDCTTNAVVPNTMGSTLENVTYEWTGPAGCISGGTVLQAAFSCPGMYYLNVRRDDNGCTAMDSLRVTQVEDVPVLQPIPDTTLTCTRDRLLLTGALPTDGGSYEVLWCQLTENGEEITNTCEFSLTYVVENAGTYAFTVTNTDTGCSAREFVEVRIDTLAPTVEAGMMDTLFCNLSSLQLQGEVAPGIAVSWSSSDNNPISNAETLQPTITTAGWYTLSATSLLNGCVGQDSVRIIRDERRPDLEALTDTLLNCANPIIQLAAEGITSSGSTDWEWTSPSGQTVANPRQSSIAVDEPGTYAVRLIDPESGCSVSDTTMVGSDFRRPEAVIDNLANLRIDCSMDTLTLVATNSMSASGLGVQYQWSIQGTGNLFPGLQMDTVQTDEPGLYRLVVRDEGNGCLDSLPFQLNGNFTPPNFAIDRNFPELDCVRDSLTLTLTTELPTSSLDFSWESSDGTLISTREEAIVRQSGTYFLTVTNLDNGCSARDSVFVPTAAQFPFISIAPPENLSCGQATVLLDGSSSETGDNISYRWETLDGGPLLGSMVNPVDSVSNPGTYVLMVTNEETGCTSRDSVEVQQIDNPITNITVDIVEPGCTLELLGGISVETVTGGTPPYSYQLNTRPPSPVSFFDDLGVGEYELVVEDVVGCNISRSFTLLPAPELLLDLGDDREVKLGDSIRLTPTPSREVIEYTWQAIQSLSGPNPVLRPTNSQLVVLTVVDALGCEARDTIFVNVIDDLPIYAPTAFAPGGSGQNTHFTLYSDGSIASMRVLQVFDRWGNMVFEGQELPFGQPLVGWDGRLNGKLLNSAVYIWRAELVLPNGQIRQLTGDVVLMN